MTRFSKFIMEASFSDDEKNAVWEKGVNAFDKETNKEVTNRKFDTVGALMCEEEYGNRDSEFGWEIDHIDNDTKNNNIENLRPLFWKNNTARNAKENYVFYKFDGESQSNSTEVRRKSDI